MIDYMFLLMIDHVCIEILVNLFLQTTLYLTQTLVTLIELIVI